MLRLGVVSFLNSRPLIAGLESDPRITLRFDVPSALSALLEAGTVDAALVPIIDVARSAGRWRIVSDACIGCDGETMTVRIFSRLPPERLRHLWVDSDSHTSVALATVLWRELYGRQLELRRLDARQEPASGSLPLPYKRGSVEPDGVLLIGDKVVAPARAAFRYEFDLGDLWRRRTGLPFVFAVWAVRSAQWPIANSGLSERQGEAPDAAVGRSSSLSATCYSELSALLRAARDRGVKGAAQIAERDGPRLGWSVELARRYLTRCLTFRLDARHVAGAERFVRLCAGLDLVPPGARLIWPEELGLASEARL